MRELREVDVISVCPVSLFLKRMAEFDFFSDSQATSLPDSMALQQAGLLGNEFSETLCSCCKSPAGNITYTCMNRVSLIF